MPRYPSRSPAQRRPVSHTIDQTSDAMLFGITRGLSGMPQRDPGSSGRQLYRHGDTFEESYPRFEFSTLVTLSLAIAKWFHRLRQKAPAKPGEAPEPSFLWVARAGSVAKRASSVSAVSNG